MTSDNAVQAESRVKPRRTWLAVILTLLTPGLGHLYIGQPKKAVAFWILSWVFSIAGVLALLIVGGTGLVLSLLLFTVPVGYFLFVLANVVRSTRSVRCLELRSFNRWYIYAGIIVLTQALTDREIVHIKTNVVEAFWFPSGSMQPTLLIGDHFLVDKRAYASGVLPARGDVVVFVSPVDSKTRLAKRAVALAGDTVEIREKKLYVNGSLQNESYVRHEDPDHVFTPRDTFGPVVVPEQKFFVLGDNRDKSYDSRFWGFVPGEFLLGRATVLYWSRGDNGPRWERIGVRIR